MYKYTQYVTMVIILTLPNSYPVSPLQPSPVEWPWTGQHPDPPPQTHRAHQGPTVYMYIE